MVTLGESQTLDTMIGLDAATKVKISHALRFLRDLGPADSNNLRLGERLLGGRLASIDAIAGDHIKK